MAKSLKEVLSSNKTSKTPDSSDRFVIYHFRTDDVLGQFIVRSLLNEQRPYVDLGKGRAILCHKAHIPHQQDHLHFMVKGAKIAAINKDGTAHDSSHGTQLQRWALDGMTQYYHGFRIPLNGLIETLMGGSPSQVLTEGFDAGEMLLTQTGRLLAEAKAVP